MTTERRTTPPSPSSLEQNMGHDDESGAILVAPPQGRPVHCNEEEQIRLPVSHLSEFKVEQEIPQATVSFEDEKYDSWFPKVGMKFETEEHAYNFYNYYGEKVGFSVRKSWSNKKNGVLTSKCFVCSKNGHRMKKDRVKENTTAQHRNRNDTRTGCSAHMVINLQNGAYCVTTFEENHNHEVVTSKRVHMLKSQRRLNSAQQAFIDIADDSGTRLVNELMSRQAGGQENLGYLSVDKINYLKTKRMMAMKEGEAMALLHYFQKKQLTNPLFHYSIQVDVNDLITNIFWADGNMVVDYSHFGDVVCFDTTFKTNNFARPFAPFVGINNHKQTVIFGAALMYDETAESFKWLFQSFLETMSGKKPKTILTDQDAAMAKAIKEVFVDTHHRLCVWHIHMNASKHLGHVFDSKKNFNKDFSSCIYDYEEELDFLQAWETLLDKYDLKENLWLKSLFDIREKWALIYGRQTFCADMKSMQRCESLNSVLKRYLNPEFNVLHFFEHFERVAADWRAKELQASFNMSQSMPRLLVDAITLEHARDVYTPEVFQMVQKEYEIYLNSVLESSKESEGLVEYKVSNYRNSHVHKVTCNLSEDTISCSCMKFEFVGILCSHVLKVLDFKNVKKIPTPYIMKRWTKQAKYGNIKDARGCTIEDPKLDLVNRYKLLCCTAVQFAARASESEETYKVAARCLVEGMKLVEKTLIMQHGRTDVESMQKGSQIDLSKGFESLPDEVGCLNDNNELMAPAESDQPNEENKSTTVKGLKKDAIGRKRKKTQHFWEGNPKQGKKTQSPEPIFPALLPYPLSQYYRARHGPPQDVLMQGITQDSYGYKAYPIVPYIYQSNNPVMDQQHYRPIYPRPNLIANKPKFGAFTKVSQGSSVHNINVKESISSNQLTQVMNQIEDQSHPQSQH